MTALTLSEITARKLPPEPWDEGDNIPWDDPGFSERMLREHLSQAHDRASRRQTLINAHVRFLQEQIGKEKARVLDLACGPGFYLHRLARQGHEGYGIDFAPASVAYAQRVAIEQSLDCSFIQADLRTADFGRDFDLVLLVYGQFNVFQRHHATDILRRARESLVPGGKLVLEPHLPEAVRNEASPPTDWRAVEQGLFYPSPHLLLHERFWDQPSRTATERWYVVDAQTAAVQRYAMSVCSYEPDELVDLLRETGFAGDETHASLTGQAATGTPGFFVLVATR